LYKLKLGENPIKSIDNLKSLAGGNLKKLEIQNTDISKKANYKEELFKLLNLEVIDGTNRTGEEVDSTIYDEGDDEFEDDESKYLLYYYRWRF
jgi:hypothetical protein